MAEWYRFVRDELEPGGFAEMGFSGFLNKHIKSVEKVSDTEVQWKIKSDNGKTYTVTVTATIPEEGGEPREDKRTDPVYNIAEDTS